MPAPEDLAWTVYAEDVETTFDRDERDLATILSAGPDVGDVSAMRARLTASVVRVSPVPR
jgi:hypothetical protein